MEKVNGIGGLFFRAKDPDGLAQWYFTHLGIKTTEYFGDPKKTWMVNFRVSSLDAMVAQLRAAGISVEVDQQPYPNGRLARLCDLQSNPIELWEPTGRYAPR